jgi:soluble lytic murein transglycosylase
VSFRHFRFAAVLLVPAVTATAAPSYWLQPSPQDAAEAELRDVLVKSAFAGPTAAPALRRVSEKHPGSTASGLAQLAAGLLLLDAGNAADAVAFLRHPDIQKTSVADHAILALARAQDTLRDAAAAQTYLAAADARPDGPGFCNSLLRAAELLKEPDPARARDVLARLRDSCPDQRAPALLDMASLYESARDLKAAAEVYDRLDRDYPASSQAREAVRRLALLAPYLPEETVESRNGRDVKKAVALFDAEEYSSATLLLRSLQTRKLAPADLDLVRVRLARILLGQKKTREAGIELVAVALESPSGGEAAFYRAKIAAQTSGGLEQYEAVAALFPGTRWGEESLLALANEFQKDARDDEALPYFRRLLEGYPSGKYADRAAWRVGWGDYRLRRFEEAATGLERSARQYVGSSFVPGMLYWAGRARRELGQMDQARQLLSETAQRFKRTYHGARAEEALARLPRRASTAADPPALRATLAPASDLPEPWLSRVRQLLLIDRLDAAGAEIRAAPASTMGQATLAWIEARRGQLRPAITAMKRAYPAWVSEAGDALPDEVWRLLFPMQFSEALQAKALREGLDPALVAALICQESTFDAGAVSQAGARGLMQVMPTTGRTLARALRVRYSARALHDPDTSLTFGTRYLKQLLERFGGRIERVLAAYNAGPHRVEAWTAARPDIPAEEFVESIPFTETRQYVMIVLANREHYRRIYAFAPSPKVGRGASPDERLGDTRVAVRP